MYKLFNACHKSPYFHLKSKQIVQLESGCNINWCIKLLFIIKFKCKKVMNQTFQSLS